MAKRVGIYSGTFDPVHAGHIALAIESLRVCKLDEVVFFVESDPRMKQEVTPRFHREAMLSIASKVDTRLSVGKLASDRFTVGETLPELRRIYPTEELTLLMGSDVAEHIGRWKDIDMLLNDMALVVGLRDTAKTEDVLDTIKTIDSTYEMATNYTILTTHHSNVRSSHIRTAKAGSFAADVSISKYIRLHQLYT